YNLGQVVTLNNAAVTGSYVVASVGAGTFTLTSPTSQTVIAVSGGTSLLNTGVGGASGGTFTLNYGGVQTAPIAYTPTVTLAATTESGNIVTVNTLSATSTANAASFSAAAGTVTITTAAPHGFAAGESVLISNSNIAGYNGTFVITSIVSPTQF